MKQLNNIGNFFRKRLIDSDPVEQDWNMPSEDIWTAAKPHFPKEKKNRKWLAVLIFAGLLFLSTYFILNVKSNAMIATDHANEILNQEKISDSNSGTNIEYVLEKSQDSNTEQTIVTNTQQKIVIKEEKSQPLVINDNRNSKIATLNQSEDLQFVIKEKTQIHSSKKSKDGLAMKSSRYVNQNQADKDFNKSNNSSVIQTSESKLNTSQTNVSSLNKSELFNILTLAKQNLTAFHFSNSILKTKVPSLIQVKQNQSASRWELGIAASQFYKKPNWIIEHLLDEDDVYDLQSKQMGFNISLTKLVSNRFSYSTGLIFNNLDFDLEITDTTTFGEDVTIEVLKKKIQDFVRLGNLSVNGNEREIAVEIISESDLSNGDVLNLIAEIPIQINLYQLPFILHFRTLKNKWEWNASAGVSLDFVRAHVKDVSVDVLKKGISIINPVAVEPISDISLAGSIYVGSGIKYELYPQLALGFLTRLDITELSLSKYELGLYYKL